jgi:hypothetical protein
MFDDDPISTAENESALDCVFDSAVDTLPVRDHFSRSDAQNPINSFGIAAICRA